ncbi:HPr-rel-A system PqqD family peptide chaperone [Thalassotalea euphylliae]|uniref:HPr-rel-A system PqqD family peptide chaperone n=1 Tax=Thalassotalea euphylliae TaxID=1655234 RepID=A0A3E0TVU8_9GAMM|nr:HPr-rel-A system PqqD family peptide chaperone [Thalassotalea euphylliae]REL28574.1 HPr-rel-A system PqqD family peptide chaperone [Thalassotalea euphylliae]
MKRFIKHSGSRVTFLEGDALVYSGFTGKTHLVDANIVDVMALLSTTDPIEEADLFEQYCQNSTPEEKQLLTQYITDIIENLLALELISYA